MAETSLSLFSVGKMCLLILLLVGTTLISKTAAGLSLEEWAVANNKSLRTAICDTLKQSADCVLSETDVTWALQSLNFTDSCLNDTLLWFHFIYDGLIKADSNFAILRKC